MSARNQNQPSVLIVEYEKDDVESTLSYAYSNGREIPFVSKTITKVDRAIEELKRRRYSLVLATEFMPEIDGKMNVDEWFMNDDLLRLLQFLLDSNDPTKVCVISSEVVCEFREELYRQYPSVVDVFGLYYGERKFMAIRKIIRQYVPAAEETRKP